MDVLSLATALMGLFPTVWQLLYGLATSRCLKRLLKQHKRDPSSESVAPDVLLEDFIQELNSWIQLIVNHRGDVVAAFDGPVAGFVDSTIRELRSIVKDAQSTLKLHNSSKKSHNNRQELMDSASKIAGLNQRALKIIRSFFEFMFNEVKNMGILGQNSTNQYQLSRNNATHINIFNIFIGDCNGSKQQQQQLQAAARLVNQIMNLNLNNSNITQCSVKSVKSVEFDGIKRKLIGTEEPSALMPVVAARPCRIRRKPSFKKVSPVSEVIEDMRLHPNHQYCERSAEKERRVTSASSLASTSGYYSQEQKNGRASVTQKTRNRDKSMMIKSNSTPPIAVINETTCRMSTSLSLNPIRLSSQTKRGTYLSYRLSYNSSDCGVGALMGDKNIFDLGQNVSHVSGAERKLHFYTECEVLEAGTVLGLGLAVAGGSDEYKYFKDDKMAGWYNKSCGFDGRLGTINCNTSFRLDYRTGSAPVWPAGEKPYFREGDRLGMGVRLSNDGFKADIYYTRNGVALPGDTDLGRLWSSDMGRAPPVSKADIRLVVALAGPMSRVRLTFFQNIQMPS